MSQRHLGFTGNRLFLTVFPMPFLPVRSVAGIFAAATLAHAVAAEVTRTNGPTFVPPEMFSVPEGLEITVWATTPLLYNPTNIEIDQNGRVWVAEGVNYRGHAKRRPDGDRIVVLE